MAALWKASGHQFDIKSLNHAVSPKIRNSSKLEETFITGIKYGYNAMDMELLCKYEAVPIDKS